MPVRIYELAAKLGLENKQILALAREEGIIAARVPSSSLDRTTASYLESKARVRFGLTGTKQANIPQLEIKKQSPPEQLKELRRLLGLDDKVAEADVSKAAPTSNVQAKPQVSTKEPVEGSKQAVVPPSALIPANTSISATGPTHKPTTSTTKEARNSNQERSEPSYIQFERSVRRLLDQVYPNSTLSNILLFHAEKARFALDLQEQTMRSDYAFELDHLLHRADLLTDNLLVIECKNQPIRVQDERTWMAEYRSGASNVQLQLTRHIDALRAYVNPLSRGRILTIDALVVSSDPNTKYVQRQLSPGISFYLCGVHQLSTALRHMKPGPIRVAQSDILNLIRLGAPVPELGHPELNNALAYIERCRRNIDGELFRAFNPTAERWAINGSAGMGKSVLLAYSLFVLTTNRRVHVENGQRVLKDFTSEANGIQLPPMGQRGVYAFALKEKQRLVLAGLYRRFLDEFAALSKDVDLGVSRPAILLWNGNIPDDCEVLIIDEAHDLTPADCVKLVGWSNTPGKRRYLLIACDRHQKLRLVGRDEAIIEGLNFSRKTKKLRLNYRNPFAVYAASLGLMFRWFAPAGPKVIPTKDDLENGFGFMTDNVDVKGTLQLSMQNDAHPANGWSNCVEWFGSPEAALARLRPFRFKPQDVLWVRFADENEHFDYEQLGCFTYHNLNCAESVELTDKYIKGQDFPIVVLEGFSEDMNQYADAESEQRMWQRRKELYVCASRATGFLFLIGEASSSSPTPGTDEFMNIVRQLSAPSRDADGFPRTWHFSISLTPDPDRRRMDVFVDAQEAPA